VNFLTRTAFIWYNSDQYRNHVVGFSRYEGNFLKRFFRKVEFRVCVLKEYWAYGIGNTLLR